MNVKCSNNILFRIAFEIYYFGLVMAVTAIPYNEIIKKISILLSFVLFLSSFFFNFSRSNKIKKHLIMIIVIIVFLLIRSVLAKDYFLLMLVIMGLASLTITNKEIDIIFKRCITITVCVSVIAIMGCYFGFVPNINTPRGWGTANRLAWGFNHSQTPTLLFFYLFVYYFCFKKQIKLFEGLVFFIILLLLGKIFDARNATYSGLLFFIFVSLKSIMGKIKQIKHQKYLYLFCSLIPTLMVVLTFIIAYLYSRGNTLALKVDSILSGRIRLSILNIQLLPIKLLNFVSYADYESTLATTVDNGYLYIVLRYGALFLPIVLFMLNRVTQYFYENNNSVACVAFLSVCISAFVSNPFTGSYFLPFWAIGMARLFNKLVAYI